MRINSSSLLRGSAFIVGLLTLCPFGARAAGPVSYEKDIQPILESRCYACHSPEADELKGKLDLSTPAMIMKGGKTGAILIPGKADDSLIVQMLDGRAEPKMPPKGFKPATAAEIELIKTWINEGAKAAGEVASPAPAMSGDEAKKKLAFEAAMKHEAAPTTSTQSTHPTMVAALAFSPDGHRLAKGGLHKVEILSIDSGAKAFKVEATLEGHRDLVRGLAFAPDGSRLFAAGGKPARGGEVVAWNTADWTRAGEIAEHKDNIFSVAVSPDGTRLATCGYDKMVKIFDAKTLAMTANLKDHVDAVYDVAWSPDGKLVASASGDRTIKLWDAATGARVFTLSDSLDAVHTLAFSPDGLRLAGAGSDKMIRIWDLKQSKEDFSQRNLTGASQIKSAFAHQGSVLNLSYSPDGAHIYSASEDRTIKFWNAETLSEERTLADQSDWVTSLALNPEGTLLAAGRFDGSLAVYNTASGDVVAEDGVVAKPMIAAAEPTPKPRNLAVDDVIINARVPASLQSISPRHVVRGQEVKFTIDGTSLEDAKLVPGDPAFAFTITSNEKLPIPQLKRGPADTGAFIIDNAQPNRVTIEVKIPDNAPLGGRAIMLDTPRGMTNGVEFVVHSWGDTGEKEPNNTMAEAQEVAVPFTVPGAMNGPGDVDRYKFKAEAGQELAFTLTESGLEALMRITDSEGHTLATSDDFHSGDARVGHRFDAAGEYTLEITDRNLNSGVGYRLTGGVFPLVREMYPLGLPAGAPAKIKVVGFNLGGASEIEVAPPATAMFGQRQPLPIPGVEGNPFPNPMVAIGPLAESEEAEPNDTPDRATAMQIPATMNGRIDKTGDADLYPFTAKKGESILLETWAARLGSPVDTAIDVLDSAGHPLERAAVRCVAQTVMSLSDRDSRGAGFRITNWTDFKIGDYAMVGGEIVRISQLPDYADEDIQVESYASGQRKGFFGTTPESHAVDSRFYKVEIHPPNSVFPPNGMPIFKLDWRNDDVDFEGFGPGDSFLEFVAPEDGRYIARVTDVHGNAGSNYAYRLSLRKAAQDFDIVADPYWINVPEGGSIPVNVRARRKDGFNGPIAITIADLPAGFELAGDTILEGEDSATLALRALPGAVASPYGSTLRIVAKAEVEGRETVREARLGAIEPVKSPDLVVHNSVAEVNIEPGKGGRLGIKLGRNNGFTGRVPIDVKNLPVGVYVLDTGLNGILVRENETERPMEIFVEPWVKPMTRKIYLTARIETRSTQSVFLGEAITLKIGDGGKGSAHPAIASAQGSGAE